MFCLAANYNAPHNNTPMLGVHAHGALIRAGAKWLDFRSCPVIADVMRLSVESNGGQLGGSSSVRPDPIGSQTRRTTPACNRTMKTNFQTTDDSSFPRVVIPSYCCCTPGFPQKLRRLDTFASSLVPCFKRIRNLTDSAINSAECPIFAVFPAFYRKFRLFR